MDYSGKIFGDWAGIGKYDEAAHPLRLLGRHASPATSRCSTTPARPRRSFPGSDGSERDHLGRRRRPADGQRQHTNPNVRNYTERFHYSTVPLHFGEGSDLDLDHRTTASAQAPQRHLAKWTDVKADENRVRDALLADPTLIDDPDRAAGVIGNPLLRVPYMFCSDDVG